MREGDINMALAARARVCATAIFCRGEASSHVTEATDGRFFPLSIQGDIILFLYKGKTCLGQTWLRLCDVNGFYELNGGGRRGTVGVLYGKMLF